MKPPRSGNTASLFDLIAFLGVLALGGVLIALGRTTAGSLATSCAALGALYAVWQKFRFPRPPSGSDETGSKSDEDPL
jgi:hypothetical protein